MGIGKRNVAEMPAFLGAGIIPHILRRYNGVITFFVYISEKGLSETIKFFFLTTNFLK